jgi:hypothetical protein
MTDKKTAMRARGLRHNLYEHINLSLRTIDIIIAVVAVAIIVFIILGVAR